MTYRLIERHPGWSVVQNGRTVISGATDIEEAREAVEELNRDSLIGLDFAPDQRHRNHIPINWGRIGTWILISAFCAMCWFGAYVIGRYICRLIVGE